LSINANEVITWTPSQTQSPSTNTNTDGFDTVNPQLTATNSFNVIVKEVNVAPILSAIPDQMATEQTPFSVANTATDSNIHAVLSYALVNPPAGMSINSSGVISWTPTLAQAHSTNTITTVATSTDNFDTVNPQLTATNHFTVVVKAALVLGSPEWLGNGQFEFSFDTDPNVQYTIQYSVDMITWTSALTFEGVGGVVSIIDPNAGQSNQRFYRIVASP
jgi:hypothetical protein